MRHFDNLPQFYGSKEWEQCKAQVLHERAKGGVVYCEHCGKPIVKGFNPNANNNAGAIVFHHKIYLNNYNVNDASVSINPDNIQIVHWNCHNEIHQRFGFSGGNNQPEKKVYIIVGAPCSGQHEYVKERIQPNDIVLDVDNIWEMVSGQDRYIKPNAVKPIVFNIRDNIKQLIARGTGTWRNAFIIESLPSPADRNREAERYKAFNTEVVIMDATEDECLNRLHEKPNGRNINEYEKYIKEYYQRLKE